VRGQGGIWRKYWHWRTNWGIIRMECRLY